MIIISQDKTKIIKFKEVEEIVVKENDVCVIFKSGRTSVIGTYNKPETAIKILKVLANSIGDKNLFVFGNESSNVYEMP